jgi:Succinylglutamate desuccinylase / Aspartoacylase family
LLPAGWSELAPGVDVFFRKGKSSGPFALITAGIHGDEYEGPAAVACFVEQLAAIPSITGSIAAIPAANPMAWRAAQRTSPEDGLNLARTFPGRAQGSATERLAASLFEVAAEADYLICIAVESSIFSSRCAGFMVMRRKRTHLTLPRGISGCRCCGSCRRQPEYCRVSYGSAAVASWDVSISAPASYRPKAARPTCEAFFHASRTGR